MVLSSLTMASYVITGDENFITDSDRLIQNIYELYTWKSNMISLWWLCAFARASRSTRDSSQKNLICLNGSSGSLDLIRSSAIPLLWGKATSGEELRCFTGLAFSFRGYRYVSGSKLHYLCMRNILLLLYPCYSCSYSQDDETSRIRLVQTGVIILTRH